MRLASQISFALYSPQSSSSDFAYHGGAQIHLAWFTPPNTWCTEEDLNNRQDLSADMAKSEYEEWDQWLERKRSSCKLRRLVHRHDESRDWRCTEPGRDCTCKEDTRELRRMDCCHEALNHPAPHQMHDALCFRHFRSSLQCLGASQLPDHGSPTRTSTASPVIHEPRMVPGVDANA
jgi:hypothetical protein